MSKETYIYVKRDLYVCHKWPISMSKVTYIYFKRGLYLCRNRTQTTDTIAPKQTHTYVKRDLYLCQKRPISMPAEAFTSVSKESDIYIQRDLYSVYIQRDLHWCPISVSKVTYIYVKETCIKRDLYLYSERPIQRDPYLWQQKPLYMYIYICRYHTFDIDVGLFWHGYGSLLVFLHRYKSLLYYKCEHLACAVNVGRNACYRNQSHFRICNKLQHMHCIQYMQNAQYIM